MHHILNKQVIDMRTDNRLDSFALQQKISDIYYDDMLPLLEKLFDELSNEDELISLDCLEIDLGIFTEKELHQKDQLEKILSTIRHQVNEKLRAGGSTAKSSLHIGKWSLNVFRQWIFYMRNGYLPWNSPVPDENWFQKVLEAGATDHQSIELLRQLIRTDEYALKRIIFQHS